MNSILLNSNKALVSAYRQSKKGDYVTIAFSPEDDCHVLCWGKAQKMTRSLIDLQASMGLKDAFYCLMRRGCAMSAKAELELANGTYDDDDSLF